MSRLLHPVTTNWSAFQDQYKWFCPEKPQQHMCSLFPMCHHQVWPAISRCLQSIALLTHRALCPGRPKQSDSLCQSHQRRIISRASFKLNSIASMSYHLPGDLNNEYAVSSPVSPTNSHTKDHLLRGLYQLKGLYPGRPE